MAKKPYKYRLNFDFKSTTGGADTYGHDMKFFGDTTGKYIHWDASADTLYVVGTLDLTGTFNTGNIALIDNETITMGTGSDINFKFDGTNLLWSKTVAAGNALKIDADTVDTTADVLALDIGVNSASVSGIKGNLDIGTALSAGEIVRGVYLDINSNASNVNTSGMTGFDCLITGVASGADDLVGYKVLFDGTKNAADSTKGLFVDGDLTINNANETLYGAHFDFSGTTHTNGTLYGTYVSIPTAASGSGYGHYILCNDNTTGIYINSGSTDRTAGNVIEIDLDVNDASVSMIKGFMDWGTASTTAKTVRGLFLDFDDIASGTNGTGLIGSHMLMSGIASGNSDIQAYKAEFDGSRDQGDTVTGLYVDNNQTINNANELFYGTRITCDGITHTNGKVYAHIVDISQTVTAGDNFGLHETLGLYGIGLYMTGTAGKSTDSIQITANAGKANFDAEIDYADRWEIFDDFNYQTIANTYTPWILTSGIDAQAADPVISTAERGTIQLVTGDVDGDVANDGSQIICSVPVQADSGGLIAETRLYIDTAITEISVWFGFTDVNTLEEPVTNAADSLTFVADDAAVFHFDDGATTKQWFAAVVDSTVADAGNGATGSAPVAGTYQKLRIEVSADGTTIKFYVNDTLVKTISGDAGITETANLYCTVGANATTTTSKTVVVDYIKVGHNR